ncbi:MAG: hypothetical protein GC204_00820 [Chloroflexi bacterium]|nr:hypothetical protein [Chloroflexota bacterium]
MAEKNYERTTRICELEGLRADHLVALRDHMAKNDLVMSEPTLCGETTSIKRKNGWLDKLLRTKQSATYTSVVITPVMLMWVVSSNIQPATAFSAPLSEIEVSDTDSRQMLDRGLDVRAQPTGVSKPGSYFIGLSEDEGGSRLRVGILEAVKAGHTP